MSTQQDVEPETASEAVPRRRRGWGRFMVVIRRLHLYAGLFLLPWVFLYGVTGAMFNHQGLFPEVSIEPVSAEKMSKTPMAEFPSPEVLAQQVVESLQSSVEGKTIKLAENHGASFTNEILFEAFKGEHKYVVSIDPVQRTSRIIRHSPDPEKLEPLLSEIQEATLTPNPHEMARHAASDILHGAGIEPTREPQPLGWTKLNFLANVDGEPARVTYVLKDRHVELTHYNGDHGMSMRRFFLRLHTSHGQSPHWNSRRMWSFFIDAMAIAMVTWGVSGVLMWWQIKRTRMIGLMVIGASLLMASVMYFNMMHFYAATKL